MFVGTAVFPSISGTTIKGNDISLPLPRYREGGTPYDPSQSLRPQTIQYKGSRDVPTSGLIASPPEYSPVRGVLFTYKSSDWASVVTNLVVELTKYNQYDEIAYVVVSSTSQMNSAITAFTNGGANMSKVQFIIEPINAIWMRDYGPHFIWQDGALGIVDSHYYPTRPLDNFIPTLLGDDIFHIPTYDMGLYYSGGNFQPGPNRSAFVTALINTDNPASEGFNASFIAELFHTYQGIDTLHVMPQLPVTVDGTGHIDMWMYLVNNHTVIISKFKPGSNQQAITITENAVPYMQNLGFTVYRTPAWVTGSYPNQVHYTYTNAFRVNNRIFVPTYGDSYPAYHPDDVAALANWTAAAGPDVTIVPINSYSIIPAAGAVHCIVMQIPRYVDPAPAVHVISPDGNQFFVQGTTEKITWVATDTNNVVIPQIDLYYSTDNGATYTFIATTTNIGSYNWTVPFVITDQAKIKVVAVSADSDQTAAESVNAFTIMPAQRTTYDFSTGAGVNKFGYGYQTASWTQINHVRKPVSTQISSLVSGAYQKIAYSDATGGDTDTNRYISPTPSSGYESTHVFEFTINEDRADIQDIAVHWEGYAKSCTQEELYVWDYTAGQWCNGRGVYGQNRFMDNWAGNRDGYLDGHIRSNFSRYVNQTGQMTVLLYTHRSAYASFHDYIFLTISSIHHRELAFYPEYLAQVNTGASVMKTMLDYLMWNSTQDPQGPPSVYDEQSLYDTYSGGDDINANEFSFGMNDVIDDEHHGWVYGYYFVPNGYDNVGTALRDICTWIDFPVNFYNSYRTVPVPKPGHTNHVPVAIPLEGDYNHWVSVKGMLADHDAWNYTGPLTIYGFWLNDPLPEGIGTNTFVSADTLASEYYQVLNEPGDTYDNHYVTLTDPPHIQGVAVPNNTDKQVIIAQQQAVFNPEQARLVQQAKKDVAIRSITDAMVVNAAHQEAATILAYSDLADIFNAAKTTGTPAYHQGTCTITFANGQTAFTVELNAQDGTLRQIQVN